jgi:hypothetical protein
MKVRMLNKGLAVAVIILFLGLTVQPSVAVQPETTDNNDDCDLCPKKVSKSHLSLIKNSLNRLEKYDNQLLILSKYYPEFEEKFQELSEEIATLKEINKELSLWNFPIICKITALLFYHQLRTFSNFSELLYSFRNNQIILIFLSAWGLIKGMIFITTWVILEILNCPQWP